MERINTLIRQWSANQKNQDRGPEGMERRKRKDVGILTELVSLTPPSFFRYHLMQAEAELSRAVSLRQDQEA